MWSVAIKALSCSDLEYDHILSITDNYGHCA